MPSRSGFLTSSAWAMSSARAGIGDAGLGDDLDVGIVAFDRRLEGVVALVGHVILRVVIDPGDLALLADRRGERVGGVFAHLEQIVGDDGDVVLALHEALRLVGEQHDLDARGDRRLERLGRGDGIERQRENGVRLLGEDGLDVALLLGGVEAGVGLRDDGDAEPREFVLGARRHRVHEIGRGVPEQRGGRFGGRRAWRLRRRSA